MRKGVCSILSGALKLCLVHGLRQPTRDVKCDIKILNLRNDVTYGATTKNTELRSKKVVMCRKMS